MVNYRDDSPSAEWLQPEDMDEETFGYAPGKILLGTIKDRLIGIHDNRHIVTIAGSRAGKTATSLLTNLRTWPGSILAIDPKGELATNTAEIRARMGQDVFILDPFNEVTGKAANYRKSFNPIAELKSAAPADRIDDAALLADALVVSDDGRKSDHWSLSAKNLIHTLSLFIMDDPKNANLIGLRNLLSRPQTKKSKGKDGEDKESGDTLNALFEAMANMQGYGGVIANAGSSFSGKPQTEAASIISTAVEQTAFLRSDNLATTLRHSDFALADLKRKPTTIYLVLPASRMATHYRWLRVILIQALAALERTKNQTGHHVLFVLEEFPVLGHMRQLEAAAGLMAGSSVKLWTVIQDLSQIKALYPNSWETFLGNAGLIEAFGNSDGTTTEWLSKRIGNALNIQTVSENLSIRSQGEGSAPVREQIVSVPLLAPFEITLRFSRDVGDKLCVMPENPPFIVKRLLWTDDRIPTL